MKKFTKEHEWVDVSGENALVGITEYAAKELGDITFIELPKVDTDMIVGDVLAVIESVKAASDVYCPVSGTVSGVNTDLEEDPSIVNSSPEENGWICEISDYDIDETEGLMDKKEYDKYTSSL